MATDLNNLGALLEETSAWRRSYLAGSCSSLHAQAEAERDLELLALPHEVAILHRHVNVKRPELLPSTVPAEALRLAFCRARAMARATRRASIGCWRRFPSIAVW